MDKTDIAIEQMDSLKGVMTENMRNLLERDEKLDSMLSKTDQMSDLSYSISKKVRNFFEFYFIFFSKFFFLQILIF